MASQLYVTSDLMVRLAIPMSGPVKVRAGVTVVEAHLEVKDNLPRSYVLSPRLARSLNLENRKELQIRYDSHEDVVHIGPIVGILIEYLPKRLVFDPKSLQAELIYLSKIGRKLPGLFYIFTPGSINWSNKTVVGYAYNRSKPGRWEASIYPLPDVVYDRITSRKSEMRARIKQTKRRLDNLSHIKYFNPSFLNKWKVHRIMVENEIVAPYLPETHFLNLRTLTEMLRKYRTLYLKPCNGSLGNGIIKVVRNKRQLHYTVYRNRRRFGIAQSPGGLLKATHRSRGGKAYIVQQGINLATYKRSPFDIRIVVQKNGEGDWLVSKKFVRVAPRGSSIANLSRGGHAQTSARVFNVLMHGNQELIQNKTDELNSLCLVVAKTLEKASQKIYGELGLDVGIDKDGNLWLIEINSKPRKTTETMLSKAIMRNTFRRPLQYAMYLAGFKSHQ